MIAAPELLDFASGAALIGDTGYDSDAFRAELKARGIKAVISSSPKRKRKIPKNRALYRTRYLVEIFFHSLKRFRGIATRFDKTSASYLAFVHIACIALWLN
jgi:transposase